MKKGCPRMAKRWVIAAHQSAPLGLEWLPSGFNSILTHVDFGKMILDPHPSFQAVWLNQKCWSLKNGGVGWGQGCTPLQVAHHNLTWQMCFPNNIGIVWEVGGNGEVRFNSIAGVAGYNFIRCLSLHIAAAAQHRFTSLFLRIFKPRDIEIS